MKLVNSIYINRPAGTVWDFLINPANMLLWNPKVKHVSSSSLSDFQQGYHYGITYQLSETARATEFLAEFVLFEPFSKLVIRHKGGLSPQNSVIEEIYELSEQGGRTFLTQSMNIENSGINIIFRFLIWVIQRWGKPTGKPYLAILRDTIENGM